MVTVAIMQPYFFPNLEYYRMIEQCDTFVILDDVGFQKRGFLTRNVLEDKQGRFYFRRPVQKASLNRTISEHNYLPWERSQLRRVENSYNKTPHFDAMWNLLVQPDPPETSGVVEVNTLTIKEVLRLLGSAVETVFSSKLKLPTSVKGEARILAICELLEASTYLNLSGGAKLYDSQHFSEFGIKLEFMKHPSVASAHSELEGLSILHSIAHLGVDKTRSLLTTRTL